MKKKIGFTVKEEIITEFRELADKNSLNQSNYIEKAMVKYIENCRKEGN